MYRDYFGLKENPFSIAPDPRYLYMSEGHREALAHLVYGINNDGAFILLTGEVGTGKTTVCRCLLERLPENAEIAFILNPKLSVEELLATVCDEFGISYPEANRSNKVFVSRIYDYLLDVHAKGRRAVLIIEEAQNLSMEVLEQLRLLTNLETNQSKLLQIIMLGQPELQDMLSQPQLRQLSQRITARYHLGPLSKKEIGAYVSHRLEIAGLVRGNLFPSPIIGRLFRLSGGIPRVINLICDRALLGVYVQGKDRVDRKTLTRAAREVSGGEEYRRRRGKIYTAIAAVSLLVACAISGAIYYTQRTAPASTASLQAVPQKRPVQAKSDKTTMATLERPMDLARRGNRDMAYGALFTAWGIRYNGGERRAVCEQARGQGLRCLEERGSLRSLRHINRPAVLRLLDDKGGEYLAVMASLNGETATFVIGNETRIVDVKEIANRWSGDYTLLWRAPPDYKADLKPGMSGLLVTWLDRQLAKVNGRAVQEGRKPIYDDEMVKQVKEFQVAAGLVPDGIVGARTIMFLTGRSENGGPWLDNEKGKD